MASKYLTPEEADALKRVARATQAARYMDRSRHGSTACLHSPYLKQWMKNYAEWLALQPGRPSVPEKRAIVNRLAQDKVSAKAIRFLEQRADFLEYHDKFASGAVTAARAKLEAESPWYIEQHRLGLEQAIREKDYKAIPNFTGPVVERVWPRREGAVTATQVTIHLSPRQETDLTQEQLPAIEAEIIAEPEPDQP